MSAPRLAQKVISGRYQAVKCDKLFTSEDPKLVAEALSIAPLISADEAGQIFMEDHALKRGTFDVNESIPTAAPPFPAFWIECHLPELRERWGVLWIAHEKDKTDEDATWRGFRWVLEGQLFIEQNGRAAGPAAKAFQGVLPDGRLSDSKAEMARGIPKPGSGWNPMAYFVPSLLAISFMHCKNVHAVEQPLVDSVTPKAERSKRERELSELRYYTLKINPMKEVLRSEGNLGSGGLQQALHVCRGHFKDYRASGLFGKIKGLFWWDQQTRGASEAGVVVKDYEVRAPAPREPTGDDQLASTGASPSTRPRS